MADTAASPDPSASSGAPDYDVVLLVEQSQAAQLLDASTPRILFKHLLPMLYSALLTQGVLELARVVLVEASLSYLGLGIQPPTADWGSMVRETAGFITFGDPTPLLPAGAIALLTVAVNFVVDWQLQRASGLKE